MTDVIDLTDRVSVMVLGEARLFAHSVARVLESNGFAVAHESDVRGPSVVVLVEPLPVHWRAVGDAGAPAVVLTSSDVGADELTDMVVGGAEAVLSIESDSQALVATVERVAAGESGLTRAQARLLTECVRSRARASDQSDITLTRRELEILRTIDAGLAVKQTARQLGISPRTVENTQRVLYRKLAVRNRAQAVATAYRLGLLPGDQA